MSILRKTVLFFSLVLIVVLTPSLAFAEQVSIPPKDSQEILHIRQPLVEPGDSTQKNSASINIETSDVGYVDVWISTNPKKINWNVVVYPPYKGNGFIGYFNITNLSSGLSSGRYDVTTMSGSMTPPIYTGKYGATLTGVLTYNGVTTGVTLNSPYLVWEN